jgi:hypothetical protein
MLDPGRETDLPLVRSCMYSVPGNPALGQSDLLSKGLAAGLSLLAIGAGAGALLL